MKRVFNVLGDCYKRRFVSLLRSGNKDKLENKSETMLVAGAGERNKRFISDALKEFLPKPGSAGAVVEIASGPGQHVTLFATENPHIKWQPTDIEKEYLQSIAAHTQNAGVSNINPPVYVDISKPTNTPDNGNLGDQSFDAVVNINMVHISPWETSLGLFSTAGRVLKPSGVLFMYGPFRINGSLTPESNVSFDASLRARDPSWGIRDTTDLDKLALQNGLKFEKMVDMPANNKCLIYRKLANK